MCNFLRRIHVGLRLYNIICIPVFIGYRVFMTLNSYLWSSMSFKQSLLDTRVQVLKLMVSRKIWDVRKPHHEV